MTAEADDVKCFLCKTVPGEMEFCMPFTSDGEEYVVKVILCLECWGSFEDDGHVLDAVLEKANEELTNRQEGVT